MFCLFFITSMDSGKDGVGGLGLWARPMTVCICVYSTKRCGVWCPFGKAYVHVHTGVHVCECICLCLLIIHGYFFQTKHYALLCMIYGSVSQAAV